MNKVSKYKALSHYQWGEACDGWNLADEKSLSVKQERMPAHTAEKEHYHNEAQQFFFILKGRASFTVEEELLELSEGEGLHIAAGKKHRISNDSEEDLEFILCSHPSTAGDRINCE
jgi:mannose-6-phosphate isomerase-like protein (cupin superfamily)